MTIKNTDAKAKPIAKPKPKPTLKPVAIKHAIEKPLNTKPVAAKPASAKKAPAKLVSAAKPAAAAKKIVMVDTIPKVETAKAKKTAPKPKRPKLIRDSFTIPDNEYKLIQTLKERSITTGLSLKKSELIRAGILKLIALNDTDFKKAISAVEIIKTGRPTKAK